MAVKGFSKSVFYIVDDFHSCGWYRCNVPGSELQRRGYEVELSDSADPGIVDHFDVIVFQRQWQAGALHAMRYAKAQGKTIVYELDDDLWNLHESNPAYEAWSRPEILGAAEEILRAADVVTTTTPALARQLRRFNKNVAVLPNMLPPEYWQVKRERPADYDKVVVGWAGSASRARDLSIVKEVGAQLLDRYPNVELLVATGDDTNMVFAPHERVRRLDAVPIERYAESLATFDIGIAPVVDSRFNQAKSDLKFLEYSMVGIPTVASAVESYVHSIENGVNGFLAKNDKDWLKYLCRLVEQPDLRRSIGEKAKELADASTIDKTIGLWESAYGLSKERSPVEIPFPFDDPRGKPAAAKRPKKAAGSEKEPVSIVVLTHNQLAYTMECFEALRARTTGYELIVVDNASADGTVEYLKQLENEDENVRVVLNTKNRGFAAGCNQGVKLARHKLICLLNNDTVPFEGWLDALRRTFGKGVGAVGAKLLFADGTIQHGGIVFRPASYPFPHFIPDHRFTGAPGDLREANVAGEVAGVTAACLLTSKRIWHEVGGLDEGFVMANFEDVDLNLKIRERGYKVVYQPESVLTHYQHKSIEAKRGQADDPLQHLDANLERLLRRWNEKLLRGMAQP